MSEADLTEPAAEALIAQRLQAAMSNASIPAIYVNGFTNTMSSSDILIALETNGRSVAVLNMSFTMAKTLSLALGEAVAKLEEASGRPIMTSHQVEQAFEKVAT